MKKIAVIGIKGIPSRASGIEVHVENIYSRISDEYRIIAYCRKRYCNKICGKYNGIYIKYMPSINTKHLDAITYTFFSTIHALFMKVDIYHFHALGPSSMAWLPKLFKKKVICTVHGLDWKREKWGEFGKAYLRFGEKIIAKHADKIIVLTESDKKYFQEKWKRESIIIPNGVNTAIEKKVKQLMQIEGEYILFLARIVPEKGVHYLIEAYQKSECTKKLVIAGGSSHSNKYIDELYKLAGDNENIIFTGKVEGEKLIGLYQNAALYVLPSDLEGQPISLLEAMSYGCLCLVSDIEANVKTLGDYGFYFKQGDISSLAEMLTAFEKGVLKIDREYQKKYVLENYSWKKIAKETSEILEQT